MRSQKGGEDVRVDFELDAAPAAADEDRVVPGRRLVHEDLQPAGLPERADTPDYVPGQAFGQFRIGHLGFLASGGPCQILQRKLSGNRDDRHCRLSVDHGHQGLEDPIGRRADRCGDGLPVAAVEIPRLVLVCSERMPALLQHLNRSRFAHCRIVPRRRRAAPIYWTAVSREHPTVAILGAGAMGEALALGLLEAGWSKSDIELAARRAERASRVEAEIDCRCVLDPAEIVQGKDVIVVAVKPRDVHHLLEQIHTIVVDDQVILSLAAGVPTTVYEKVLGEIAVVRAMPNTPAVVREGITGMASGTFTDAAHLDLAERVLKAVGPVTRLDESLLDAVTAVSGTGPAYAFLLAEALTEAAIREGLPRDVAELLVHQTIKGAGALLVDTNRSPFELRSEVTSPGGTTAAAMHILEERGFRALVEDAVRAAAQRSRELGGFAIAAEEDH